MLQTTIAESLNQLPENLQQEVLHYIEFLCDRYSKTTITTPPTKRGALGAWKGKIKIADDFDAPLEDFQDYM
jgi:Protein of unknown function (DUF2281)